MNFIPHVFVGIGEKGHFFTLRRTYLPVTGRRVVLSEHVKNLSQDRDEAIEEARVYAFENGMVLKTHRDELPADLSEIFKRKRGEAAAARAARDTERAAREAAFLAAKAERRKAQEQSLIDGIIPFGVNMGKKLDDLPDFAKWLVNKESEFEEDSILRFACSVIRTKYNHLLIPAYADTYLDGSVGLRVNIRGIVEKVLTFDSHWGTTRMVIIKSEDGSCVVAKGKWYTEEGKQVHLQATIKDKSVYRGQKQTSVNRVKEIAL